MSDSPRNIVIVRPDRVGDVVISSSCLPALRERFPHAALTFVARPVMAPLFTAHPFARFLPLPDPNLSFLRRVAQLRRDFVGFDCVVFLHPDGAAYLAARQAGIPRRIGYPERWVSWTLTDCVDERRPQHTTHEAVYNFDLLQPLGLRAPQTLRASVELSEASRLSLERKITGRLEEENYLCLHLGAFSPVARWPTHYFLKLAEMAFQRQSLRIVLVGHDRNDAAHRFFQDNAGSLPYIDLAGELDLGELGWLLRGARALVARDSGPAHLAAAVGTPLVVLFGRVIPPHGPTRWTPLAEPSTMRVLASTAGQRRRGEGRDAFWRRSCASIPPEAAYHALEELLFPHHIAP